ncbi:MAG: 30S ribosomal protein S17 [Candidatus Omnitrophica bacterium]|nr:30S ribosomal protein S17 [Candidatus Omnitrophota bacterium]
MAKRKEFTGTVISDKMEKTRIVRTMHLSKHPKYGKVVKRHNKFKAHDETNTAKLGDIVRIVQTRPLSKDKCFRIVEIVRKSATAHLELKEEAQ